MQSGGDFRSGGPPWCFGGSKPVSQYLGEFWRFPLTRRLVKPAAPACVGTYGGGLWRSAGVRLVSCRLWLSRCSLCGLPLFWCLLFPMFGSGFMLEVKSTDFFGVCSSLFGCLYRGHRFSISTVYGFSSSGSRRWRLAVVVVDCESVLLFSSVAPVGRIAYPSAVSFYVCSW